jgi:hypothetical protein
LIFNGIDRKIEQQTILFWGSKVLSISAFQEGYITLRNICKPGTIHTIFKLIIQINYVRKVLSFYTQGDFSKSEHMFGLLK